MKDIFIFCLLFALGLSSLSGKTHEELLAPYEARIWEGDESKRFLYRTASPDKVTKGEKYPLLVFFHGAGGRGNDNKGQLLDAGGLVAFQKEAIRSKRESYVFAGQVPKGSRWVDVGWNLLGHRMPKVSESMKMAFDALDAFIAEDKNQVDSKRIYVMGLSMGGYGTWDAIQRRPGFFAAAVPICGGGDKSLAKNLIQLPIWAWHGDKDSVIKPVRSREMIEAITKAGGSPKYSEIKGRGHNSWVDCWNSQEMWDWLYSQTRR